MSIKNSDAPASSASMPEKPETDKGFGESHGYGPGHGGPSGPGDAPAPLDKPHAPAPKDPSEDPNADESLP